MDSHCRRVKDAIAAEEVHTMLKLFCERSDVIKVIMSVKAGDPKCLPLQCNSENKRFLEIDCLNCLN